MWSGISYTAVDDMTWAGWSPDSAETGSYSTSICWTDKVPAAFSFSIRAR